MTLPAIIGPRLLHYSQRKELMHPVANRGQVDPYQGATGGFKPRGLWLSVEGEDDWKDYCISEGFRLERLRHTHEVTLKPMANILRIATEAELLEFDARYRAGISGEDIFAATDNPKRALDLLRLPSSMQRRFLGIDWRKVASDYAGIIIAPYQWGMRLHPDIFWYYTWDCASGCIWDASAIAEVRLTGERAVTEAQIKRNIHKLQRLTPRKMKKATKRLKAMTDQRANQ